RLSGRKRRSRSRDRGRWSIDLAAGGREPYPQDGKVDAHGPPWNGPDHLKLAQGDRVLPKYERLLARVVRTIGVEGLALGVVAHRVDARNVGARRRPRAHLRFPIADRDGVFDAVQPDADILQKREVEGLFPAWPTVALDRRPKLEERRDRPQLIA